MQSKPKTVKAYLASLASDRREAIQAVREVILDNLDSDYEEGIQYGMLGYYVPHSVYPSGYHCDPKQPLPFMSLASQKNHMSLHMFCIYCDEALTTWFKEAWLKEQDKGRAGKLDMGKGCVRFKKLEDVPLGVIAKAVKRVPAKKFIKAYESNVRPVGKPATKKTTKKTTGKKVAKKTRASR